MTYDMVNMRDQRSSTGWFPKECVLFLCRDRYVSIVEKEVKNFIDMSRHSAKPALRRNAASPKKRSSRYF